MRYCGLASSVRVVAAFGVLAIATVEANAGGFAVREQSAFGQGSSFAGIAAGGDLSSMYWNPATMTQAPGIQAEFVASGIMPYAANTPSPASTLFFLGGTGNTAESAIVPAGYFSYQLTPDFWFGMSLNAPFGLSVSFPTLWAGAPYAAGDSHLRTYNASPSIAYRINNWISVGAGVQIQYADAGLSRSPIPGVAIAHLEGNGWGYGFTAGLTLTPTPTTTIGLGYRSFIDQKIEGTLAVPPLLPTANVNTTLKLPDMISLGIRQQLGPQWTLLGTIEWTNWSRIGTATINGALIPTAIPFQYDDGWFFALGAEYRWNPALTVRAGVGYEISPITDRVRTPLLPDNDRIWLSAGATYNLTPALSLDFAYSHLFVKDTSVNVGPGNPSYDGVFTYVGDVNSHVDIVSVALKYRWGATVAARPALITK